MKILVLKGWLMLSLLFGFAINAYPQYFIVGQHSAINYYVNIEPDTTLVGPNNEYTQSLPAATFQIDINGDGNKDFSLYSIGHMVMGWGDSEISIRIYDTSTCQIAFGYYDTCHRPDSTYFLYKIAKSFKINDTISNNLVWLNSKQYLTYTNWGAMLYNCDHNGFINNSEGNYLAVRMLRPNDTLYGWIKVSNINFLTFTVQEFACNKNSTGISEKTDFVRIYPIPSNGNVTIETLLTGFDLIVYNQYGIEVMQKELSLGKNHVDINCMANGVYILKLFKDNSIIIKKLIKQ